ncbi:uncharacterized protein LOC111243242 isoform X2 [Varroa destructor]|uniref:Uncharacterized protein n=1 Tax=Varroa destructor TaxID=109461 RepID=A0A7M7M8P2_VARDE|nr:uncharacterized protein LOC111243242 isoform X2 [Varroa destructor]
MQGVNYETDDHVMVCPFQLLRAIISYRSHAENSPYILVKSCFHRLGYLEKASVIWRSKRYQNCGKERGFDTRSIDVCYRPYDLAIYARPKPFSPPPTRIGKRFEPILTNHR